MHGKNSNSMGGIKIMKKESIRISTITILAIFTIIGFYINREYWFGWIKKPKTEKICSNPNEGVSTYIPEFDTIIEGRVKVGYIIGHGEVQIITSGEWDTTIGLYPIYNQDSIDSGSSNQTGTYNSFFGYRSGETIPKKYTIQGYRAEAEEAERKCVQSSYGGNTHAENRCKAKIRHHGSTHKQRSKK